jgi:hypothetical protein
VVPPSVETSTPPTTPPPASLAVPLTVTVELGVTVPPFTGAVIVEVGAVASADGDAATSPVINVPGWTPMSAKRLMVACCMRASAAPLPRSWFASRPHGHCTVPAPNTSAPPLPR